MQSPQCSLVTVGDAIEKDPDLTARLLRLGNSSFYGFSSRLATVTEAISLIGIQQVQDLILASSIVEQFAGVSDEFVSMESFWRHSLACGIGARLLALERRLPKPDKFFVAGLLHDVGRLVLFAQAPEISQQVFQLYQKEKLLLREAEMRVLGYHHQQPPRCSCTCGNSRSTRPGRRLPSSADVLPDCQGGGSRWVISRIILSTRCRSEVRANRTCPRSR